jgi:hypothetical protein
MEQVLEAAHDAGARRAFYTVLRLPWELDAAVSPVAGTALPRARRSA